MRTERKIGLNWWLILIAMLIIVTGTVLAVYYLDKTHFDSNTMINGIDCSHLSVEEATEKLIEKANQPITFVTVLPNKQGSKEYVSEEGQFDVQLSEKIDLRELLERQNEDKSQVHFEFDNLFTVNKEAVKEYLATIPELNGENVVWPISASYTIKDNFFVIVPEVYGNVLNLEDSYQFAMNFLKKGEKRIDFTEVTKTDPVKTSDDENLQQYVDKLNTMLKTVINFKLSDGTVVTIDSSIILKWLKSMTELEENITTFLEQLAEEVDKANSTMVFPATGIGNITLYVPKNLRPQLDIEAEVEQILKDLETGETIDREPIYDKPFLTDNLTSYVELDITRQNVWAYVDGNNVLDTPCRTGNVAMGDDTPTGIYYLAYKTRGATLRGYNYDGSIYNSYVEYWMPFNGGIGFHDAYWVHVFGGNAYLTQGSHGCVNLPLEAAATLYQYINTDMPIFVYKS